jgi:enoyl-CoA hydratase
VAHITFSRPEARNAMTWAMYDQLRECCDRLRDDDVRVAVFRGEGGKAFIAGTDIGQFNEFSSPEDGVEYEDRIESILEALERLPLATVAVVEGYAVGGGLTIAAVCDLRICTPDAKFGLPIARTLGNCLSMQNYARLVALVGPARAKALIYRADFIAADDALTTGLATEVVEREKIDARVEELCEQLAGQAPLTMWATKEAIRRLAVANVPDGDDIVRRVYGSDDFKEGVSAFLDKRPAQWQNR